MTDNTEVTVEQTQTEQTTVIDDTPIEVHAAQYLQGAIPVCCSAVEKLNGNQAKVVLQKLIRSPLEEDNNQFTSEEAAKVFQLAGLIQNAKFVLFTASAKDPAAIEDAMKQGEAGQTAESTETAEESSAKEEVNV